MIKAVFFDIYGTLAGFRPSRFEIQAQACADFNITVTREGILKGYSEADGFMARQNAIRPLRMMSEDEKFKFFSEYERLVLAGSGVGVDPSIAGKVWLTIKDIPYDLVVYDDVFTSLDLLKKKGITLGLISNMNMSERDLLSKFLLQDHIDFAVTSLEVGMEKPHSPIFEEALRKAKVSTVEAMHVGDQIESDVCGAEKVGITPVLLDRDGNHKGFSRCIRIEKLSDLGKLVGALR